MKTAEWTRMLDQLRDSLDQTAIEVARHEQALQSPLLTSDLSDERHISWQRVLERVGERLQDCQAQVEQAERQAVTDEAALNEHQQEITRFLQTLEGVRGQLAIVPPGV
jgi:DNA repair exonuclease SbcCD ATPase subunit